MLVDVNPSDEIINKSKISLVCSLYSARTVKIATVVLPSHYAYAYLLYTVVVMAESAGAWTSPSRKSEYTKLMRPISWARFMDCSDELDRMYHLAVKYARVVETPWVVTAKNGQSAIVSLTEQKRKHRPESATISLAEWEKERSLQQRRLECRAKGMELFAKLLADKSCPPRAVEEQSDSAPKGLVRELQRAARTPGAFIDGLTDAAVQYEVALRETHIGPARSTNYPRQTRVEDEGLAEGLEASLLLFGQLAVVQACRKTIGL